jgi:hypothetical protein
MSGLQSQNGYPLSRERPSFLDTKRPFSPGTIYYSIAAKERVADKVCCKFFAVSARHGREMMNAQTEEQRNFQCNGASADTIGLPAKWSETDEPDNTAAAPVAAAVVVVDAVVPEYQPLFHFVHTPPEMVVANTATEVAMAVRSVNIY